MKANSAVLNNPRFWAGYFSTSFGQIGDPIESELACSAFGVSESAALKWWRNFTGWHEEVFEESDGCVDNPNGVAVPLTPQSVLEVETHPGGTMYFLKSTDKSLRHQVGEAGGHWRLPMFRWEEASKFTAHALVLSLPGVWVDGGDPDCRATVEKALRVLPLKSAAKAGLLVDEWLRSVSEGGSSYSWSKDKKLGWISSAHWSLRSAHAAEHGVDVRVINDLLARA